MEYLFCGHAQYNAERKLKIVLCINQNNSQAANKFNTFHISLTTGPLLWSEKAFTHTIDLNYLLEL